MMVLRAIVTPETVLPVAMEPIEIPWPPEQVESSMTIVLPELMATQSSWFLTVHLETVTEDALMSKPSVLWPRAPASPAAVSYNYLAKIVLGFGRQKTTYSCRP
jgi:hypothetical protein